MRCLSGCDPRSGSQRTSRVGTLVRLGGRGARRVGIEVPGEDEHGDVGHRCPGPQRCRAGSSGGPRDTRVGRLEAGARPRRGRERAECAAADRRPGVLVGGVTGAGPIAEGEHPRVVVALRGEALGRADQARQRGSKRFAFASRLARTSCCSGTRSPAPARPRRLGARRKPRRRRLCTRAGDCRLVEADEYAASAHGDRERGGRRRRRAATAATSRRTYRRGRLACGRTRAGPRGVRRAGGRCPTGRTRPGRRR